MFKVAEVTDHLSDNWCVVQRLQYGTPAAVAAR